MIAKMQDGPNGEIHIVHKPPYKVELTYFKQTGKYYTSGEYQTEKTAVYEIFAEVREMFIAGKLPGLVDGASEFYAVVNLPDHPHGYPALIVTWH